MSNPTERPDLDKLEELARAATPDEWTRGPFGAIYCMAGYAVASGSVNGTSCRNYSADEEFIAAANPAAVLALIEACRHFKRHSEEALEREVARYAADTERDLAELDSFARRAQPEGEAPQAANRALIEEAAQVFESGAAHNRKAGRTVFAHAQQDRADRLRAALASRPAEVDDEGLPPLPESAKLMIYELQRQPYFTAEQYRQGQRDAVAADRARRGANDEAVLLLREALPHISPSAVNVAIARSGPMHEAFVNTRIRKYLEQVSAPSHTTNKEK